MGLLEILVLILLSLIWVFKFISICKLYMSIRINQELNNIKNSINNLNITGTDNKQAILDETTRATNQENSILGAILIEKNRAQYAESANEQAIFSEATRAGASEGTNAQAILDETARAISSEGTNAQAILDETTRALSISDM